MAENKCKDRETAEKMRQEVGEQDNGNYAAIREITDEAETLQKEIDEKKKNENSSRTASIVSTESKSDVVYDDSKERGKLKPNAGNGCDSEKYKWMQASKDVEFQIFVKMINGNTNSLFVKSSYKISKVMELLESTLDEDEEFELCRISYSGIILNIDETLAHYNVLPESTLFLNGRVCGGADLSCAKLFRLQNLFLFVIRGHANHVALSNQLSQLLCVEEKKALKDYDIAYPMHEWM